MNQMYFGNHDNWQVLERFLAVRRLSIWAGRFRDLEMKNAILAATAAACFSLTNAAEAATFIQYEAHFEGSFTGYDGRNFHSGTAYVTVLFNIPTAIDATSTNLFYITPRTNSIQGLLTANWGNPSSNIGLMDLGGNVRENIHVSLGAATNGGLTDFENASGDFDLTNTYPVGTSIHHGVLTSFTTHFSDTPFVGDLATSGFKLVDLPPAVPEPATWALMIGGFGGIGWAMRRNKGRMKVVRAK